MYIPSSFAVTDPPQMHDFMQQHSFATLVSPGQAEPFASHLPLLLDRAAGPRGTLIGHMAKANPQWKLMEDQSVLCIFHGPHAYISPTWYQSSPAVPTWNYMAVHAYGRVKLIADQESLLKIVRDYVEFYERDLPEPWSMDQTGADFIQTLLPSIVGFEIAIDRLEGKFKLNQNQDRARREHVIQALQAASNEAAQQMAQAMLKSLGSS